MKSQRGCAPEGQSIEPEELPEEPVDTGAQPRAAPAPGVPVSDEEYERMKEAALHAPTPRVENAQEDRPREIED
jgi:hypothetical protein